MTEFLSAAFAAFFILGLCVFAAATEPERRRTQRFDLTEKDPSLYHERQAISQPRSVSSLESRTARAKRGTALHGLRQSSANHS